MDVQMAIDRTRNLLMTGKQDRFNVLQASILANATTVTLSYPCPDINEGTVLSIGLEDFLVLAKAGDTIGAAITVQPAWHGSMSTAHTAGDMVRINAQFSDWFIYNALDDATKEMVNEGCFYVKDVEITYSPSTQGYGLTAPDFISSYRVRYSEPGPAKSWPRLRKADYHIDNSADPDEFPTGLMVVLHRGGHPGKTVRLSYKASYGEVTSLALTDDLLDIGLHNEGQPVLPYCAATTVMLGREIKRNFTTHQTEPRRAEEVPPGAVKGSSDPISRAYYTKLIGYKKFLHRRYPTQIQ